MPESITEVERRARESALRSQRRREQSASRNINQLFGLVIVGSVLAVALMVLVVIG